MYYTNTGTVQYKCAQTCSEGTFSIADQNVMSYCCQTDNCNFGTSLDAHSFIWMLPIALKMIGII